MPTSTFLRLQTAVQLILRSARKWLRVELDRLNSAAQQEWHWVIGAMVWLLAALRSLFILGLDLFSIVVGGGAGIVYGILHRLVVGLIESFKAGDQLVNK